MQARTLARYSRKKSEDFRPRRHSSFPLILVFIILAVSGIVLASVLVIVLTVSGVVLASVLIIVLAVSGVVLTSVLVIVLAVSRVVLVVVHIIVISRHVKIPPELSAAHIGCFLITTTLV